MANGNPSTDQRTSGGRRRGEEEQTRCYLARLRRGGGAEALVTEIQRGELLGGGDRALGFLFSLLLDAGARDENPPAGGLWMNHPGPARGDDH